MEYWIFIVIILIAFFLICLVVFAIRCTEFNHVMRKMRAMSTSSSASAGHVPAASSAAAANRRTRPASDSPPPPYSAIFRHPIIARSNSPATVADSVDPEVVRAPLQPPEVDTATSSGVLPVDAYFIPPPYCLDPPAYCDVISECANRAAAIQSRDQATAL